MFFWLYLARSGKARSILSLLVLFALCVSFVPLPLSLTSSVEKNSSAPFPCQNRPCGCRSANQCWKSCCCFTNREKIVWAKENRVKVPGYVFQAAEKELAEKVCTTGSRCSQKKQKSLIHKQESKVCCSASDQISKNIPVKSNQQKSETGLVIGYLAQKCQGQGHSWNSLPWAIVPNFRTYLTCSIPDTRTQLFSLKAPEWNIEPPPRLVLI